MINLNGKKEQIAVCDFATTEASRSISSFILEYIIFLSVIK